MQIPYKAETAGRLILLVLQNRFQIKTFDTNHSANISFSTKGWTFTPQVGFDFSSKQLNTNLMVTVPLSPGDIQPDFNSPAYENDLRFTEINPNAS
jgi:hypothetical protein